MSAFFSTLPPRRTSRRLPAANTIHLRHITWQPACSSPSPSHALGNTIPMPIFRQVEIPARDGWKQIVALALRSFPPASSRFDSILSDSTRSFYFFMVCVFASLGFRFLFVNNNFLQYIWDRAADAAAASASIFWMLLALARPQFYAAICLRY